MSHLVTSRDGTPIAYETVGSGPALLIVDGALCFREVGPARRLAEQLKSHFTVYLYDRRGRGESGDTPPYSPERELEDLEALLAAAGGSACVAALCTGAALVLPAAGRLQGIRRLALYEVPFVLDYKDGPDPDWVARLNRYRTSLDGIARTLTYDIEIVTRHKHGKPIEPGMWADVRMPVLVLRGDSSPRWLQNAQAAIAGALPNAELGTVEGQGHQFKPEALAPALLQFFTADAAADGATCAAQPQPSLSRHATEGLD